MRDQHNEPLNDDLAREIEQALAIDPSPEFQARLRQRVAQEPPLTEAAFGWWRPALWPAAAIITTALIIIAGWQLGPFFSMSDERASVEQPRSQDPPGSKQQSAQSRASMATPSATTQQATARQERREETVRPGSRSPQPLPVLRTLDWLAPVIVAEDEIAGMRVLIADAQAGRFESVVVTEESVVAVATTARTDADPVTASSETTPPSAPGPTDADPSRADASPDVPQARPTQIASAVALRPVIIEPVTIKPLVQSLPDETREGVAE